MKYGYAYLVEKICRSAFVPRVTAESAAGINRKIRKGSVLLVPSGTHPDTNDVLTHVDFAVRNEGINLQILAEVLPQISQQEMTDYVRIKPNGTAVRKIGCLWELFCGKTIEHVRISGKYITLFDPERYVTVDQGLRIPEWKLIFNGLGTAQWCATVERTPLIDEWLKKDILGQTVEWFKRIGQVNSERALGWAYLNETKGSFELEREKVSGGKAERFAKLLRRAHEPHQVSEDFLCSLQNEVVNNDFVRAMSYRTEQNWLSNGGKGAYSVTYVPPSPSALDSLMPHWESAANTLSEHTDPIVAAAVISFGFVYLHPFMDGNGRLSRFLIHQQICSSGKLGKGQLLPISVAMKKNEQRYLSVLMAFSKPARKAWNVVYTGGTPEYDCRFDGQESMYRYWDATEQTEFLFDMASKALNEHLTEEVDFLERFDRLDASVDDAFDIPQSLRHLMINAFLSNGCKLSLNFRKKFLYKIPTQAMDWLDENGSDILESVGLSV